MICKLPVDGGDAQCAKCNMRVALPVGWPATAKIMAQCPDSQTAASGLGDRVASAIKIVARLLHIERLVKESPCCGCRKRREALNKWGRAFWWTKPAK